MHPAAIARGLMALGVDATVGVTDIVEDMYRNIAARSLPVGAAPEGPARGIAGFVHACVRAGALATGVTADHVLRALPDSDALDATAGPVHDAWVSELNGVVGDHLHASGNVLAIPMQLRVNGEVLALEHAGEQLGDASDTLLLAVHGLCMTPHQWARGAPDDALSHADAAQHATGCTAVHLWYNTGRAVADNGAELAALLQQLTAAWPTRLRRIQLLGHSMGGLVLRSAIAQAESSGLAWRSKVSHLITLGTPHLGAPAERIGHAVNGAMSYSPYTAPIGRLGWLRSAGITDLRDGAVLGHDQDARRFAPGKRPIAHVPLPKNVACSAVAASLGAERCDRKDTLMGDGLVLRASALGQPAHWNHHPKRDQPRLDFAEDRTLLVMRTNHWQLLDDGPVRRFVVQQLGS